MKFSAILIILCTALCNAQAFHVELNVQNSTATLIDYFSGFGVLESATNSYDAIWDYRNLRPMLPSFLDLYFPHDDSLRHDYWAPPNNFKYSTDFRSIADTTHTFYFDVECASDYTENVAIFWNELETVAPSYLVEIGRVGGKGVNIFVTDTIYESLRRDIYEFKAFVKKNAYNKLEIFPQTINLTIGETVIPRVRLTGARDTLEIQATLTITGSGATLEGNKIRGNARGFALLIAEFRGWQDTAQVFITGDGLPVSISLKTGWNMVSFPVMPSNPRIENFLESFYTSFIRYNETYSLFTTVSEITAGEGYFVLSPIDTTITIVGTPFTHFAKSFRPGWNVCGAAVVPISFPRTHFRDFYRSELFRTQSESYTTSLTLMPTAAYWIFTTRDTTFNIAP